MHKIIQKNAALYFSVNFRTEPAATNTTSVGTYRLFGNEREFLVIVLMARYSLSFPNSLYLLCARNYEKKIILGTSDPAYYIEDCRISRIDRKQISFCRI